MPGFARDFLFEGAGAASAVAEGVLPSSPSQSKPVGFASSPKGRALGSPRKLHLFAKASPLGRGGSERSELTERARMLTLRHRAFCLDKPAAVEKTVFSGRLWGGSAL